MFQDYVRTAFALATASGALAATKSQSIDPSQNVYNPRGTYVGTAT
jgi:hypothetical protein